MKNKMSWFIAVLFCFILAAFFVIACTMPQDLDIIEKENREPAQLPALTSETVFSGSFAADFEAFLSDKVGFRSFFMDLARKIDSLKGLETNYGTLVATTKNLGTGDQGKNYLLVMPDRVMEIFKKDADAQQAYINTMNLYAKLLPKNIRMFSMLIPTQIEFFDDSPHSDNEKVAIDSIYQGLDTRITPIPVYDALKAHKDEYIYFRTDHHWTQRGAFYGYTAFSEAAWNKTPQLTDYEKHVESGFLGYLYNQANVPSLQEHADDIEWFLKGENLSFTAKAKENEEFISYSSKLYVLPSEEETLKYGLFMGGDHQFAEIKTEQKNGKTILIMKDSYANTLIPFLTDNYETILVIDPRNFYSTVTELTEEYAIDDFLCINYIFTTTFKDYIDNMIRVK